MKGLKVSKRKYSAPLAEEIRFDASDILTLSGDDENTKFY